MGSAGRPLVVCCPRFELRVEDRVAIAQRFHQISWLVQGHESTFVMHVWLHSGRSSDRVTLHDTRCMYVDITGMLLWRGITVKIRFQRNSGSLCISRYNSPHAFVHTKIPSAYNPVANNLPASGSHRPVLELENRLPSLINIVWTE